MASAKLATAFQTDVWRGAVARRADWSEFMAAIAFLPRREQVVVARIVRRVAVLEAAYGAEIAEAMLEQAIIALELGESPKLS